MDPIGTPPVLQERLGDEATAALLHLLQETGRFWSEEVLRTSTERFERRLTDEVSKLRVDMSEGFGSLRAEMAESQAQFRQDMVGSQARLRQDMVEGQAGLRQEMVEGQAQLRQEMVEGQAQLRQEMVEGQAQLRQDLAEIRVDLIKWSFLFWIGQVVTLASLVAIMLRVMLPR